MLAFPSLPSFVVTSITPFAPRAPYKAVAAASFIIEKLAISSTCSRAKSEDDISTPSIRISGPLAYVNEVTPRTKKLASSEPGSPLRW